MVLGFVVIFSCLAAVSLANPAEDIVVEYRNGVAQCRINCNRNRLIPTWGDCPPVDCGPPVRDGFCGAPDCLIPGNRHVLHPHPDPNFFWQCGPVDAINLGPLQRKCGCGTLFSLQYNRCVHPHEWLQDCPNQPNNPTLNPDHCTTECPDCDNGNGSTLPPPVGPTTPFPPNGENCPCPCVPCIWWPCMPCLTNCLCNAQHPSIPILPQNPWNQPPNRPQHPTIPQLPPPQFPWNQQPNNPQNPSNQQPCSPQNNWNQQPNNPQNPCIQQPNNPQNPWNQQPNRPQHPTIPQVPNPPQLPWNQQPNNPQNPWNQQPNNPTHPWDQQPNNPTNPWDQQPNNPTNPWDQQPNIPNPWNQQPNIPNPWGQ